MTDNNEEIFRKVEQVQKALDRGRPLEEACKALGITVETYKRHKHCVGLVLGEDVEEPEQEIYEDSDAVVEAIMGIEDPELDEVNEMIVIWCERRDKLMSGSTKSSELAAVLLDHCLADIQSALGLVDE